MGKIFEGCMLASDVDDTLLDNGKICKRNIEAIERFKSDGGIFSLSTGRGPQALRYILDGVLKVSPSVLLNGTLVYDFENSMCVWERILSDDEKRLMKDVYEEIPDAAIEIYSEEKVYIVRPNEASVIHERYEKFKTVQKEFDEIKDVPANKVMFYTENTEALDRIIERYPENSFNIIHSTAKIGDTPYNYIEQLRVGFSKAKGLLELKDALNIKAGGLFAIGDYYNDLEMLEFADISATTALAPDDIKKAVHFIGGTCPSGAVADFIEYLYQMKGCK